MAQDLRGRALKPRDDETPRQFQKATHDVRIDGPDPKNQTCETNRREADHPTGWCVGDIDFGDDGSVFIRNPYLANAIERKLRENYQKHNDFIFRLTRDEGFSGPKVNIVC